MKMSQFFNDVKLEMTKVRFPTKKEMIRYTTITIGFILFFAVFFMLIDLVASFVVSS